MQEIEPEGENIIEEESTDDLLELREKLEQLREIEQRRDEHIEAAGQALRDLPMDTLKDSFEVVADEINPGLGSTISAAEAYEHGDIAYLVPGGKPLQDIGEAGMEIGHVAKEQMELSTHRDEFIDRIQEKEQDVHSEMQELVAMYAELNMPEDQLRNTYGSAYERHEEHMKTWPSKEVIKRKLDILEAEYWEMEELKERINSIEIE